MPTGWDFEAVAGPFGFTEGPVWDGKNLLFSDIPNSRIMRYDTETGDCDVYREDTNHANGLKMNADGELFVCEMGGRRVARYDRDGSTVTVADTYNGKRLNSPNDIAFDSKGRLWFTDPFYPSHWLPDDHESELELDHRSVYRADPIGYDEWELTRMTYDTTNPNGLLVSPDDNRLYVAQSDSPGVPMRNIMRQASSVLTAPFRLKRWLSEGSFSINIDGKLELRSYPIDGSELGSYDLLHDFYPHQAIDGMCLDAGGNIIATAGSEQSGPGPKLYVFTPDGQVIETHPSPDPLPTNCAFGGEKLRTLYLTGADGCLYRTRTDRRGYLGAPP